MSENGSSNGGNGHSRFDPLNLKALWKRDVSHVDALITQIIANLVEAGVLRNVEIETMKGRLRKLDRRDLMKEMLTSHLIWEERI